MAETLNSPANLDQPSSSPLEELARRIQDLSETGDVDPVALSAETGLPKEFLDDVVEALERPTVDEPYWGDVWQAASEAAQRTSQRLKRHLLKARRFYVEATSNQIAFSLITGAVAMAFGWTGLLAPGPIPVAGILVNLSAFGFGFLIITFVLHLLCFFRHGMVRGPLIAAAAFFGSLLPMPILAAAGVAQSAGVSSGTATVMLTVAALMAAVLYAALGSGASLLGGYVRMKREQRRDNKLSRQELLERLFQVQDRLARASRSGDVVRPKRGLRDAARSSALFPWTGAAIGLVLGLLESAGLQALAANARMQSDLSLAQVFASLALFAAFGLSALLAYLSAGLGRGLVASLTAYGGRLLAHALPLGYFGPEAMNRFLSSGQQYTQLAIAVAVGLLGGAGGHVEMLALRRRRLRGNDPAALVAEMVRLHRRLAPARSQACILVVDVAKSTRIKLEANQYDVEWTFREYQNLVSKLALRHKGEVVSTAGDGAVAVFSDAEAALACARDLQTEISIFNLSVNRLPAALRLRVGLHAGEIASDLGEAPYHALIDVAAHVEQSAPIGGIAVTDRVREQLQDEGMAETRLEIEDHRIYIVLNPMVSPA